MKIDETLKENLIADIKNILDIELTDNNKTALMRCFEITIGHYYASQFRQEVSDQEIEKRYINSYKPIISMEAAMWMRNRMKDKNRK